MKQNLKKIVIPLLAVILLMVVVAVVSAAPNNSERTKQNEETGKNWQDTGVIKPTGTPEPKKNLKHKADPSVAEKAAKERSGSSIPVPVGP